MVRNYVWWAGLCLTSSAILAGCNAAPEIEDCERSVIAKLRAPSTYHRVEARKTLMDNLKPPEMWVSIEYDAANAYGTPIRDRQICRYPLVDGRADLSNQIDDAAPSSGLSFPAEEAMKGLAEEAAKTAKDSVRNAPNTIEAIPEKSSPPVDDDYEPASNVASGSEAIPKTDLCWEGYCPCEPPQGGPDQLLCDSLRRGDTDPRMLSVGKSMREVRRQIKESEF